MKRGSVSQSSFDFINIRVLSNYKNLILAYKLLNKKKHYLTKNYFLEIQKRLRNGKYRFNSKLKKTPIREIVVKKLLEIIFINYYNSYCTKYQFKEQINIQKLIFLIKFKLRKIQWVVRGNLSKSFQDAYPEKVLTFLKTNITCKKTLKLIKNFLQSGNNYDKNHASFNNISLSNNDNIFRSLDNILLYNLDLFVENQKNYLKAFGKIQFLRYEKEFLLGVEGPK